MINEVSIAKFICIKDTTLRQWRKNPNNYFRVYRDGISNYSYYSQNGKSKIWVALTYTNDYVSISFEVWTKNKRSTHKVYRAYWSK